MANYHFRARPYENRRPLGRRSSARCDLLAAKSVPEIALELREPDKVAGELQGRSSRSARDTVLENLLLALIEVDRGFNNHTGYWSARPGLRGPLIGEERLR